MALARSNALRVAQRQLGVIQWRPLTSLPTLRHASSLEPTKPADAYQILVEQRRRRPVSPHLSIYRPQITWYGSALNRITASMLSGGLYVFGAAYLVSPLLGWHLDSASLAAAFGSMPGGVKVAAKMAMAWPFAYHGFNGVRHLMWDVGYGFANRDVQRTGWAVVGLSVVSALVLAFI